jgi:hypothetical protein
MVMSHFEVRSFLPIDLPLIHRLTPLGRSFDSATLLTRGVNTLEGAVWGVVPIADLGLPTFVLRDGDEGYVGQFRHKTGDHHAHIVFITPDVDQAVSVDETAWNRLLQAMVMAAGRRGALTLNAELNEESHAFERLRQMGFATYARQEIWVRPPSAAPMAGPERKLLRPTHELDAIGLNSLYWRVVPHLVRQAEPPPDAKHGYVFSLAGEVQGYFGLQEGKYGLYVQAMLNPTACAHRIDELLVALLNLLPKADRLPIYFCVRRDQEWMQPALAEWGFAPQLNQAVMVKHTTRRIEDCAYRPIYSLEAILAGSFTPASQIPMPLANQAPCDSLVSLIATP